MQIPHPAEPAIEAAINARGAADEAIRYLSAELLVQLQVTEDRQPRHDWAQVLDGGMAQFDRTVAPLLPGSTPEVATMQTACSRVRECATGSVDAALSVEERAGWLVQLRTALGRLRTSLYTAIASQPGMAEMAPWFTTRPSAGPGATMSSTTIYQGPPQEGGVYTTHTLKKGAPNPTSRCGTEELIIGLDPDRRKVASLWWPEVLLRVQEAAQDCPAMQRDLRAIVAGFPVEEVPRG